MLTRTIKGACVFALTTMLGFGLFAQEQPSPWVDRAEYDLVEAIKVEKDATRRLTMLETWKEKYPTSKYKKERLQSILTTAQEARNVPKMKAAAAALATEDPNGMAGLLGKFYITQFGLGDKTEASLADAEKSANSILGQLDATFAPDKKLANVTDEAWKKERTTYEVFSLRSLGSIAMQRKDYVGAESQFAKTLAVQPQNAEVSSLLGAVIFSQKKPEKQSAGLWHYARAASLSGEGALADGPKAQTKAFVEKTYINFHGSREGLDEIYAKATAEVMPPPDFKIVSKLELDMKNEEELKATNPQLALWLGIKKEIAADVAYFDKSLKGVGIPKFKGKLISQTPETNPKELVLSIADGITPEVTLKFETALRGKAEPGIELEFEGVPSEFTADPFNMMIDVEADKLTGWPKVVPAAKKPAPARARRPTGKKK